MKSRVKRHAVVQPLDASYRLIPLTQGQNAIVDVEDFEWLSQWNWYASYNKTAKSFYAQRADRSSTQVLIVSMHREILGCETGEEGDHRNHQTLDNRRKNLRHCTRSQNQCNTRLRSDSTSRVKGICFDRANGKWVAYVQAKGHRKYYKRFDTFEQAVLAREAHAKILHGEFKQSIDTT